MKYHLGYNNLHQLPCVYDEKGTPLCLPHTTDVGDQIVALLNDHELGLLAALVAVAGVYTTGPGLIEIEKNIAEGRKLDRSLGISD